MKVDLYFYKFIMIIKKSVEKSPYQWSLANSYLQNHQGRKHFWGVDGKDYGLV